MLGAVNFKVNFYWAQRANYKKMAIKIMIGIGMPRKNSSIDRMASS